MTKNPFSRRYPDNMSWEEMRELFAKPAAWDAICDEGHLLVLGGRWSGKTTLLKALSLPAQPPGDGGTAPPFLGVYIPLKFTQIQPFVQLYERTSDRRLFDAFISWYVLFCFASQVGFLEAARDQEELVCCVLDACALDIRERLAGPSLERLASCAATAWKACCRAATLLGEMPVGVCDLTHERLLLGLDSAARWLWEHGTSRHPIALLLDGLDTSGPLASSVLALMRKDNLDFLVTKAGAYALEDLYPVAVNEAQVGYPTDFGVVCLELDPFDGAFIGFVQRVAQRRWEAFLRQHENELCQPVIRSVAQVFPSGRGEYSGLENMGMLASGNVQAFLDMCESAWEKHALSPRGDKTGCAVSPEHQEAAIREKSTDSYLGIPAQARELGSQVQSLVYGVGLHLREQGQRSSAAGVKVADARMLDQRLVPVLRRAVSRGILRVPTRERVRTELSEAYVPSSVWLNTMLFPKFSIPLSAREPTPVTAEVVLQWCQSPAEGQLDFFRAKRGGSPQQSTLFPQRAFLSSTMGEQRSDRATRILRVVHAITKAFLRGDDRLPERLRWHDVCEDVHDLRLRGDFADQIDNVIRNALYVIHDVTEFTRGVAFEIGLSMGHRKPYFLIFDQDEKRFGHLGLPNLIKNMVDIKGYPFGSEKFKSYLDQQVVQVGWDFGGSIGCARYWDRPCPFAEYRQKKPGRVYIHVTPLETGIADAILGCIRKRGLMSVQPEDIKVDHKFCRLCCAIHQSRLCLVTYRNDDVETSLILGLALASGSPTVKLRNTAEEPLPMWGSRPVIEWTRDTLGSDIPTGIDDFIARLPSETDD